MSQWRPKSHDLLHPPRVQEETGTWGHREATNLTRQTHAHKDQQMDCAAGSAAQRKDLPTWESKQTQAQTPLLSGLIPCLSVVSSSSRNWGKKLRQNQSEKPERWEGLHPSCPTECPATSSSMDEVQAPDTDSVPGIILQLLPPRGMLWLLTT